MLPVPVTLPTIDGRHIIMISYAVDVILDFHKAANLGVRIPVTIGTAPTRQQTQYSSTAEYPPPYPVTIGTTPTRQQAQYSSTAEYPPPYPVTTGTTPTSQQTEYSSAAEYPPPYHSLDHTSLPQLVETAS